MSIRQNIGKTLMLGWMIAGLQVFSSGQNPPAENPPVQNPGSDTDSNRTAPATALSAIAGMQTEDGAGGASSDVPRLPVLLGGPGISATFLSEMGRSNYLRGGVNVGAAYDTNPVLLSRGAAGDASVSIFPNINIQESSSRMRWTLGYAGGLTINQSLANQNQDSQNLNFDSQYRLSPHVNLRVAENFSLTTGFFDAGNGTETIAGSGGPNASLIAPLSTQRSSMTTVETNYHFALNDLIGASGSFYDLHFTNVPAGTQLADSETSSGAAFWLHRILGEDWGGITYRFQRITFSPGGGETDVHSFLALDTLSISSRLTLTGFVGPQYTENQGLFPGELQATQSSDWSLSGGAEGAWKNQHTSLSAGYSRSVSDGGGVLGTVLLQTIHANIRRQLNPGWAAALTASYATNRELIGLPGSASSVNLTAANISLERTARKSTGLRIGYTHDFQQQFGLPAPTPAQNASRNLFSVTLSYQWAKPLGM